MLSRIISCCPLNEELIFDVKMNEDDVARIMITIGRTWKLKYIASPARFPSYTVYSNFAYFMKDTLQELTLDLAYKDHSNQVMEFKSLKRLSIKNAANMEMVTRAVNHVKVYVNICRFYKHHNSSHKNSIDSI